MRNLAVVAAGAVLTFATPAFADDWDFLLVNDTGKEIKTIEVSPASAANWQANKIDPDVKDKKSVAPAGRTTIHFSRDAKQCSFDLRATYSDSTNMVWTGLNVCDNAFFTLHLKNGAPTFTGS